VSLENPWIKCKGCGKEIHKHAHHYCKPKDQDLISRKEVMKILEEMDCNVLDDKTDIIHETIGEIKEKVEMIKGSGK
jgi:hypothetical protein